MESSNVHALSLRNKTELQNELFDEWKREPPLYYCNPDWMISGGQILWNAIATCEMFKTSWQPGKLRMNEDLGNSSRRLYLPSSYWTESSIIRAERRVIPCSTEVHWCHQVNSHRFGRCTRKTNWWLLEWRWRQKSVRFVDRFQKIHTIERKPSKRIYVVRGETNKNPNDITSRSHMAWGLDKNWKSRSKKRKTRMGNRETETRTRQKIERNLFYWFERRRMQRHHEKMQGESWRRQRQLQCHVREHAYGKPFVSKTEKSKASEAKTRFSCMTEAHEPTRQRIESVTKRIHEERNAGKWQNSVLHYNLVHWSPWLCLSCLRGVCTSPRHSSPTALGELVSLFALFHGLMS